MAGIGWPTFPSAAEAQDAVNTIYDLAGKLLTGPQAYATTIVTPTSRPSSDSPNAGNFALRAA